MKIIAEGDLLELLTTGQNRRYRDIVQNKYLFERLKLIIKTLQSAESVLVLPRISFLHYEKLRYSFSGLSSVRLSNSYVHRLIFREAEDRITLVLIEIDDTHYGNK